MNENISAPSFLMCDRIEPKAPERQKDGLVLSLKKEQENNPCGNSKIT